MLMLAYGRGRWAVSQHFALSEKYVLMLAYGSGRWAVSQKGIMIKNQLLPDY